MAGVELRVERAEATAKYECVILCRCSGLVNPNPSAKVGTDDLAIYLGSVLYILELIKNYKKGVHQEAPQKKRGPFICPHLLQYLSAYQRIMIDRKGLVRPAQATEILREKALGVVRSGKSGNGRIWLDVGGVDYTRVIQMSEQRVYGRGLFTQDADRLGLAGPRTGWTSGYNPVGPDHKRSAQVYGRGSLPPSAIRTNANMVPKTSEYSSANHRGDGLVTGCDERTATECVMQGSKDKIKKVVRYYSQCGKQIRFPRGRGKPPNVRGPLKENTSEFTSQGQEVGSEGVEVEVGPFLPLPLPLVNLTGKQTLQQLTLLKHGLHPQHFPTKMTRLDIIPGSGRRQKQDKIWKVKHLCKSTSVDAERLFSFSGGTVSKLCNQLSEHSAHAALMVGQWAGNPDLTAAKEFEAQLVEGWSRKKKRKADVPAEGQSAPKVVVIADHDGVD
ncbi:hypothetical protein B0H13DRAFT_1911102 [Mycena leptocephala]|nr:hypothetical protein B0H13DRAFT_1911102 [Mycena leptocephala]